MGRLAGKVVIITGAAGGMGAAGVKLFAQEGARIIAGDVNEGALRAVAEETNSGLDKEVVVPIVLDVSRSESWEAAVLEATGRWGGVDVLVNTAGIIRDSNAVDATEQEWDDVIGVNQKGTWLGVKHVVPSMRTRGGGSIVNISSSGGLVGQPKFAAYQASKGAVRMISKNVAVSFGTDNIRCNTIYPGPIRTAMMTSFAPNEQAERAVSELTLLGRLGEPEEIAYTALFLASDESSYVTGADITVDGGYTAQ